ncbi:MAG: hypothetical protein KatS3mg108_2852 [Isosphaeraceae bacterium]|jgi:hypothetical protein|nr:MAG: hypothetical protein KatS3mg108_2852 [Isosphaeraceae bacterium]
MDIGGLTKAGALLVGLCGVSLAAGSDVALRWKLEKGQRLGYEFTQRNAIEVELENQEIKSSTTLQFGLIWDVESVEADGSARLKQTVDYVRVEVESGMQEPLVYDSRQGGDPPGPLAPLKALYASVTAAPYELTLDARGQVRDVKVPEDVIRAAQGSPAAMLADGGSLLSAKGVERLLAQVIPPLPEGSASQGATWDLKLELPAGPLQMAITNTYSLDQATTPEALVTAQIDTAIKPASGSPLEVEVSKQSGTGRYRFEVEKGRLRDTDVTQDIRLILKVMGREIPQHFVIQAALRYRDDLK